MKKHSLLLTGCLLLGILQGRAQQTVTYETAKKKAQSSFDKAIDAIRTYNMQQAIQYLEEALKTEPGFTDAYGQLGMTYTELKQYPKALQYFEKLKQLDSNALRPAIMAYSKAMAGSGNFAGALALITQYMVTARSKSPKLEQLRANYDFAVSAGKNVPFQPQNMGDAINTKDPEYFPSLTIDDSTLIFTRRVNGRNEDFFITRRNGNSWKAAQNMGEPVNSAFNEGA